jgi:signal transduction histidine kinase
MHPYLQRQLEQLNLTDDSPPLTAEQWRLFLEEISQNYHSNDQQALVNKAPNSSQEETIQKLENSSQFPPEYPIVLYLCDELRTAINAIHGFSQLLQEEAYDDTEELVEFIDTISKISQTSLAMIENCHDFSRIETGHIKLYIQNFNILNLIEDVVARSALIADNNSNTLEILCADDIGKMSTDLNKLTKCLVKLLSNASKFTSSGVITFSVTRQKVKITEDSQHAYQDWIVFTVKDTGIGMTPDELARLFTILIQLDGGTTCKYIPPVRGLGLTITEKYCKMMGGDITAVSELDKGSTFTIRLPAKIT